MLHVSHSWVGYIPGHEMLFDIIGNVPSHPLVPYILYSGSIIEDRGEFLPVVGYESLHVGRGLIRKEREKNDPR